MKGSKIEILELIEVQKENYLEAKRKKYTKTGYMLLNRQSNWFFQPSTASMCFCILLLVVDIAIYFKYIWPRQRVVKKDIIIATTEIPDEAGYCNVKILMWRFMLY